MEEWSTDEEGEGEYDEEEEDDEEDDEDEYLQDEYYEDYPQLATDNVDKAWEPQAKTYSNMNLKDQVSRARLEGDSKLEEEKRLKQAKKRAEKRKKQKEKKLKEAIAAAGDGSVDEDIVVVQTKKVAPEPDKVVYSEKELDR
jgi:phosphatidate phosphatase PAH1